MKFWLSAFIGIEIIMDQATVWSISKTEKSSLPSSMSLDYKPSKAATDAMSLYGTCVLSGCGFLAMSDAFLQFLKVAPHGKSLIIG